MDRILLVLTLVPLVLAALAIRPAGSEGDEAAPARSPAVAGAFYPGERAELEAALDRSLAQAHASLGLAPVAIVAPHAGYVYCGAVLGEAWRQAQGHDYDLIVILGTNHTTAGLDRMAVWRRGDWRTPLGSARVDEEAADALLAADPRGCIDDVRPHLDEHSIEVQVPYAQRLFPRTPILPVVVGTADRARCERFGRALAGVLEGRRALIVASSDLSHYPAKADAERVDKVVLAAVAAMDPVALQQTIAAQMRQRTNELHTCACGEAPIVAAMVAARALGATHGAVIAYANSGDVPRGDASRVVGYGAVAFTRPTAASAGLSAAHRALLLQRARRTIQGALTEGRAPELEPCPAPLQQRRGAFVTLHEHGRLRGCIGHLEPDTPLCEIVAQMAVQAALHDPRFPPLAPEELPAVLLEISVLTPPAPIADPAEVVVGRDGVVLRKGSYGAVYLPQVATEQGWDRRTLLDQLALKAGLPADAWRSGAQLWTFQAEVFGEAPPQ